MTKPQPTAPPPPRPFQFRLRTLLLLFAVLGSSLAVFGAWGIVVFGLVTALALYLHTPKSLFSRIVLAMGALCSICIVLWLLTIAIIDVHRTARRAQCINKLHQIALALHEYHKANGCFPPAYVADKDGKPMHSWRVLILSYLERNDLYKVYNFNEPWDGPNNKKLLASRPWEYGCPSDPDAQKPGAAQTSYVAVVGPNTAWPGSKSRKLGPADFPGGENHTVMLVEVADSRIAWTEPRDLSVDALGKAGARSPEPTASSRHGQGENFLFTYDDGPRIFMALADGSVQCLRPEGLSTEGLWRMLQVGACHEEELDRLASASRGVKMHPKWPNIAALAVWLLLVGTLLVGAVQSRRGWQGSAELPAG
jgi:hypothetical protein